MRQKNILEYLEETEKRAPNKEALSDGTEKMTFSEVGKTARAVGSALLARGLRGKTVGVFCEKMPHTVAAFFGVIYAGAAYVCLSRTMPAERVETILGTVCAPLVICDEKCEPLAKTLSVPVVRWEELAGAEENADALADVRRRQIDTDPIYVVFTSGSTGVPKGVVACHRSVIDYTDALCAAIPFDGDTVFGNQTPLYFDAPLKELMPTFKLGAKTVLIPKIKFSFPVTLVDFMRKNGVNTVCWVVSAFLQISSLGLLEKDPPTFLRLCCFGSEVFPRKDYDAWRKALPEAKFFNLYGPTEATGMSCYWPATRTLAEDEPIPVGFPFDNTDLLLVKEDGTPASDGEEGEIYLRGTCVTLGYFANEEQTSAAFVQNPLQKAYPETVYRTGDYGRLNRYGELEFHGRRDGQIKRQGHRIELSEIDAAALSREGVIRSVTLFEPEEKKILLFYVGDAAEDALRKTLASRLAAYMMPDAVFSLDKIPLTENGKTDRRALLTLAKTQK